MTRTSIECVRCSTSMWLLDTEHVGHSVATTWFAAELAQGWASCPITENDTATSSSGRALGEVIECIRAEYARDPLAFIQPLAAGKEGGQLQQFMSTNVIFVLAVRDAREAGYLLR